MKKFTYTLFLLFIYNFSFAQYPTLDWVSTNTSSDSSSLIINLIQSIHEGNDGFIYTVGNFNNEMDFDPSPNELNFTSDGLADIFIQKHTSNGEIVWTKIISSLMIDVGHCIKTDSENNVYISGKNFGPGAGLVDYNPNQGTYFPPNPISNFILKLDGNGNFIWVKEVVGQPLYFEIDQFDNLNFTGRFIDSVDADPGSGILYVSSVGSEDVFLQQLNNNGELNWVKTFGGILSDLSYQIQLNQQGEIYISSYFNSQTIDLDPSNNTQIANSNGASDIYVSKFSNSGDLLWAKTIGGLGADSLRAFKLNHNGELILAGSFYETVDFDPNGGTHFVTATGKNAFLLKLDSDGNFIWVKTFDSNDNNLAVSINSIDFDEDYNIFFTGNLPLLADLDPSSAYFTLTESTSFIAKLTPTGDFIWGYKLNGYYPLVYTLNDNNILISGGAYNLCDFDMDPSSESNINAGTLIYLAKYSNLTDPCVNFGVTFSEFRNITCLEEGFVQAETINGDAPFVFSWNNPSQSTTNDASFETGGNFTVVYSDSNNCVKETSFHIDGPSVQNQAELNANLILGFFRSGFPSIMGIDAFNDGCLPSSGQIKLKIDPYLQYNISSVPPDLIAGDTLIWNFSDLTYDLSHFISDIYYTVIPQAQVGDSIRLELFITSSEIDFDTTNNHKVYVRPIINSYDPNDIQISPQGFCSELFVDKDEKLTYTIRFQNTGNAEAVNIHVLNQLDPNLDISTFRIIGKSFEGLYAEIKPNNLIDFKMDSIMLPDSLSNELGSQGYIIYEIKAISGTQNNTSISNFAEIYFDFNPAVITNTVTNTLIDEIPTCQAGSVGLQEQISAKTGIKVFPNPSSDLWHIEASSSCEWTLYSYLGQVLQFGKSVDKDFEIDASNLKSGVYLLKTEFGTHQLFKN